jgi:hypothetical protein
MHGQIEISHTMADDSSTTVIGMKAVREAYQQAFDATYSIVDYKVTTFDLESEIDIPEESDNEDEEGTLEYSYSYYMSVYSYTAGWGCRFFCPNDDDLLGSSVDIVDMQGSGAHLFFEKLFCHKMKKSGLLQFKKINHCSIDFDSASVAASFAESLGVASPQ